MESFLISMFDTPPFIEKGECLQNLNMEEKEFNFWGNLKGLVILLLLSVVTVYAFCPPCWTFEFIPWEGLLQSATIWLLLAYGNSYISIKLDQRFSWIHHTFKRFALGFLAMITYTSLAVYAQALFFSWVFGNSIVDTDNFYYTFVTALLITTLMTAIGLGRSFLLSWRQSAINEEKLKRENIQSRFETLKNQVNPHFLFNSFNVLTELVYQDQDKAAQFIQQLSAVYRYVLEKREQEVVLVADELAFLEKYMFLQQIRFQEGLVYDVQVQSVEAQIPPMTLQLLVENAIKHNIVLEDEPLHIRIIEQDGYIEVLNNIQEKRIPEASSGVGLSNIQERYKYLSEKEVKISKSDSTFSVKLPLLTIRKYADTTY